MYASVERQSVRANRKLYGKFVEAMGKAEAENGLDG